MLLYSIHVIIERKTEQLQRHYYAANRRRCALESAYYIVVAAPHVILESPLFFRHATSTHHFMLFHTIRYKSAAYTCHTLY